jgi:N-acetylneuraminate synthase
MFLKDNKKTTYIIAEAGVNHNGSPETALRLIDAAADSGADAVKFQTFSATALVRKNAPKAEYQKKTTGEKETQWEMLSKLELSPVIHEALLERCRKRGIEFLSSPFDQGSLDFLTDCLGMKTVKLGSGEITNGPLLLSAARKGVSIILSTGMATIGEVETALSCLAFGYTEPHCAPSPGSFLRAFASGEGRAALMNKVLLLHCTSEYPAPVDEVNLKAMVTLRNAFRLPVGYSDHTEGTAVSIAAVALGACIIEKHFTLDREQAGPDHRASLDPVLFSRLVKEVRLAERSLGTEAKVPSPSEWDTRELVRKSIVASRPVRKGEIFTSDNLAFKRPGNGMSPFQFWELLGRTAGKDYEPDEGINE